jgi:hypothetical protein
MTNKAQLTANNKHPLALRHYLLWPLLGFFLFVGLLTVAMVYWGAQQSIAQFSAQLSEQVSKTAEVTLSRFFASGIALAKTNQDALATGLVSLDDKIALQQLFVSEIKSFPYKTFISAADRNGEYVGATRSPDTDDIQIMTATLKNDRMLTFYALGKDNLLGERYARQESRISEIVLGISKPCVRKSWVGILCISIYLIKVWVLVWLPLFSVDKQVFLMGLLRLIWR